MSSRDNLREQFTIVITNQLTTDFVQATYDKYNFLLTNGVEDEQAKELLGFYLENYIKENIANNSVSSEGWEKFLNDLNPKIHLGNYEFTSRDERRNLKVVKDRFGEIKSDVGELEDELLEIECFLVSLRHLFQINSSEAKKILHVVIDRILNLEKHISSDYTNYTYEDILCLADGLEEILNPYVNEDIKIFLEE